MDGWEPTPRDEAPASPRPWEPPRFELISLSCEISSYAPDDDPLF